MKRRQFLKGAAVATAGTATVGLSASARAKLLADEARERVAFDAARGSDKAVTSYFQNRVPYPANTGDLWNDLASDTLYRFNGEEWLPLAEA